MTVFLWTLFAFLLGSIPFSVLLGRLAARRDIRQYGDGNPGGTNVMRAAGKGWGALAVLLDMGKGALPVGMAWFFGGLGGMALLPVTLAPIFGHAYSPFLKFRGGKAVATTGGIWIGLTTGEVTLLIAPVLVIWVLLFDSDGWAVILAMLTMLVYLILRPAPDPVWFWVWAGNFALLAWKHQADLRQPLRFRSWFRQRFFPKTSPNSSAREG